MEFRKKGEFFFLLLCPIVSCRVIDSTYTCNVLTSSGEIFYTVPSQKASSVEATSISCMCLRHQTPFDLQNAKYTVTLQTAATVKCFSVN